MHWKLWIDKIQKSPLYEGRKVILLGLSLLTLFWVRGGSDGLTDSEKKLTAEKFFPAALALQNSPDQGQITYEKMVTFGRGDTLSRVLTNIGVTPSDAQIIAQSIGKVFPIKSFKPEQELTLTLTHVPHRNEKGVIEDEENYDVRVDRIEFNSDDVTRVIIARNQYQDYKVYKEKTHLNTEAILVEGDIENGLYADAYAKGVPISVIHKTIEIFSSVVDFQRDLQPGDKFQLVYEKLLNDKGEFITPGRILYGNLILSGEETPLYRYDFGNSAGYYNQKGESMRKSLLMTPVDGARISSGFGMRRHPVLGYSRQHKGIDFAVPYGTAIKVAGDGVVTTRQYSASYGNMVQVRHSNGYSTIYAHMSRFNPRVKRGDRVQQGDVVGYVGCTGLCSGPHLHYEVIAHGNHIDPRKLRSLPAEKMNVAQLGKYLQYVREFNNKYGI